MNPNIILITTDQQRGDCYGFDRRRVKTPHIDSLASNGTAFELCITPNLVCQPARASILTGLLPLTHGVRDNGIDLPIKTGITGFAGLLSSVGYHTHFIGKAHFSTQTLFSGESGSPECKKSSVRYGADWRGPYMGFQEVDLLCSGHNLHRILRPPHGLHYERWFFADGKGAEKLDMHMNLSPTKNRVTVPFHSQLPPAWHSSSWIGDRGVSFIEGSHRREPFCLWISFPDPHYPFDCPEPWSRLHHPDDIDLPANPRLDVDGRPWWHRAFVDGASDSILEIRKYGLELITDPGRQERQLREMIANYYGMISLVDHQIGRMAIALDDAGLSHRTLIVVTSDHGDFLGDHGLLLKGPCAYEGLLRVGLVMRGPGVSPGRIIGEPVSTLDLAPTFLELAEVESDQIIHGRSLIPLTSGVEQARDYAYHEWDMSTLDGTPDLRLRTVRTKRHKLTMELNSSAGEMYDLENDPGEMENLFNDPGQNGTQQCLTDMIKARPDDALESPLPKIGWA